MQESHLQFMLHFLKTEYQIEQLLALENFFVLFQPQVQAFGKIDDGSMPVTATITLSA